MPRRRRGNSGKGWETQLMAWHATYRRAGKAWVVKTNPPVGVIGSVSNGHFHGVYTGKGPPDFVGVIGPTGIAVAFDAKDTRASRFDFSQIKAHQAQALDDCQRAGGICFIALRFQGRAFVLPWGALGEIYRSDSARSLSASGVEDLGIPMTTEGWLQCL